MSQYRVQNPVNNKIIETFDALDDAAIEPILEASSVAFTEWSGTPVSQRAEIVAFAVYRRGARLSLPIRHTFTTGCSPWGTRTDAQYWCFIYGSPRWRLGPSPFLSFRPLRPWLWRFSRLALPSA